MPWLSPDAWLDRCGPLATSLRAEYRARGGEDALAAALDSDPRRVVALVGAPGAGTSRMALYLASRAPLALYPDPLAPPDPAADVDALAESLASAPDDVSPLVVLDGPSVDERLACLRALVERAVHPRLHVLVPCDHAIARNLRRLAGDYPTRGILVATVQGEAVPSGVPDASDAEAALPFAVLGRCTAGRFDGEAALIAGGAVAVDGGEAVCLLVDRARASLVDAALIRRADGEVRLARILEAAPHRHAHAFGAILRWAGDQPPLPLLETLVAFSAEHFPDPRALWDAAVPLARPVVAALARRGRALVEQTEDPACRARLHLHTAIAAHLAREEDDAIAAELRAALAAGPPPVLRADVLSYLAGVSQDAALAAAAVDAARGAGDDAVLAAALRQRVSLLRAHDDRAGAIASCREWVDVEGASGTPASLALASSTAVQLAVEADDYPIASRLARRALEAHASTGNVMGELFARYRYAGALFGVNDIDGAAEILGDALALAEHIGDDPGIAYSHWLLGSIADKRGDPATADRHYSAAIDAYAIDGPVPPRLLARQRVAAMAADQMRQQTQDGGEDIFEDKTPEVPTPPEPEETLDLVQLLVRRGESGDR